jgi:hypothetical protein
MWTEWLGWLIPFNLRRVDSDFKVPESDCSGPSLEFYFLAVRNPRSWCNIIKINVRNNLCDLWLVTTPTSYLRVLDFECPPLHALLTCSQQLLSVISSRFLLNYSYIQHSAGLHLLRCYSPVRATITAHCTPSPAEVIQPVVGHLLLHYSQVQAFAFCAATPQYNRRPPLLTLVLPSAGLHLLRDYSRLQALTSCTGRARCRPLPTALKSRTSLFILQPCPSMSSYSVFSSSSKNPQALFDTVFPPSAGVWKCWLCNGVHLILSAGVPQTSHTKFNLKMPQHFFVVSDFYVIRLYKPDGQCFWLPSNAVVYLSNLFSAQLLLPCVKTGHRRRSTLVPLTFWHPNFTFKF